MLISGISRYHPQLESFEILWDQLCCDDAGMQRKDVYKYSMQEKNVEAMMAAKQRACTPDKVEGKAETARNKRKVNRPVQ